MAGEDTLNPLPEANSSFLETLRTYLLNEFAERFGAQYIGGFVLAGGIHGTEAGLVGTPSSLGAFPGGYLVLETASITYADASTTWVIVSPGTTGNLGAYTRVSGTHYLLGVNVSMPAIPTSCLLLMKVVTSGGAITAVTDYRQMTPLISSGSTPGTRLIGTDGGSVDVLVNVAGAFYGINENTGTTAAPVFEPRWSWAFDAVANQHFVSSATVSRTATFPDKTGTVAYTSDLVSGFASGTRMLFDQDAAPTDWTRDAVVDDAVPLIVSGARTHGGSWTIAGLTVAAGSHWHEVPLRLTGTVPESVPDAEWPAGGSGTMRDTVFSDSTPGAANGETARSGDIVEVSASAVSSDGTWRPVHRDVILCEKD